MTFTKRISIALLALSSFAFAPEALAVKNPKITVFIHGSLPPVINSILQEIDIPLGLTNATQLNNSFFQGNVPALLSQADTENFPLEHFYVFGWPGTFSRKVRLKAAEELYTSLKKLKGDITVIGHSHGGSVALNLAAIAADHKDTNFSVERLILLGSPVQAATKHLITSTMFKDVVSFYSPSDFLQICDMQGLYTPDKDVTFFSERNWPTSYNIPEVHVCFDKQDAWHLDFIREKFLTHLPKALSLATQMKNDPTKKHAKLTIHKKPKSMFAA